MKWYGRRPWSDGKLMGTGLLSGLLFLIFCLLWEPSRDVSAGAPVASKKVSSASAPDHHLTEENLLFPVPAVTAAAMANSFSDPRGQRVHHAVDILAPRHSEVVAVADGTIARMMSSVAGGIAVYEYDAEQRYVFYYAHLQGYAAGLKEGDVIKKGQVLGYVGTTGNAPANTPHLHFAIAEVEKKNQWWGGKAINPYSLWR